jgi:tRNA pseudouridine38-40 synthase
MRNIKLTLEYDGTDFRGWQSQKKGERTVQSVLEGAVLELTGRVAKVVGSGRTDSGVHALGQVASFRTPSALDPATIKRALNALLPPDLRVVSAEEAPGSFHPRYGASGKSYFYLIANAERMPPFIGRYVWRVPQSLSLHAMRRAGRLLVGRHDFGAFRASGGSGGSSVREIRALSIREARSVNFLGAALGGRLIRVRVEGTGFLRHMVRNIVGTLVECGRGRLRPEDVLEIVASRDRRAAGPTAPAKGLFLEEVYYD